MEDSIFTRIIKGEIPCHKIYEDDRTLAFLDIHPIQPGQTVVVPKTQANFIWDLESEDYAALMMTVQKVGRRLREVYADKSRVAVRIEGFDVDNHAHVVIIPANNSDEFHGLPSTAEPDHAALAALAEKLRIS